MKKFLIVLFSIICILIIIYLIAFFRLNNNKNTQIVDSWFEPQNNNVEENTIELYENYSKKEFLVEWNSMYPLIKNWEKVQVLEDFYETNSIQKWDIVLYDFKWTKESIVKSIYVTNEDKVEFKNNYLYINDEELKNSVWDKYNFSQA